jgi:hypothetical protein
MEKKTVMDGPVPGHHIGRFGLRVLRSWASVEIA